MNVTIRIATLADIPALQELIRASVYGLQGNEYTRGQIDGALGTIYGTDRQMIADGSFYVAEIDTRIAGCGGWSRRRTSCGSDSSPFKDDTLLDPSHDPAKIRGFFVHPEYARRGLATQILCECEDAARAAGFQCFELLATLTRVPLYKRCGDTETETLNWDLGNGEPYTAIRMQKTAEAQISARTPCAGMQKAHGTTDSR